MKEPLFARLTEFAEELASLWPVKTEQRGKNNAPTKLQRLLAANLGKQVVLSSFKALPENDQTRLGDMALKQLCDALIARAHHCLKGRLSPEHMQQVLTAEHAGPLYLMGLALLAQGAAREEWEYERLATEASNIGHLHLAYLSQLDVADWQKKKITAQEMTSLAKEARAMVRFTLVAELTGKKYRFEAGWLMQLALTQSVGIKGLRTIRDKFDELQACLLDAGFQDLEQPPRDDIEKKDDKSLRNRITYIASRGGGTALGNFVKYYDTLKNSYGIPGARIADIAKNRGGARTLEVLHTRFPELLALLMENGMEEEAARDTLIYIADKESSGETLDQFEQLFCILTEEPYHFLPEEVTAIAGHTSGHKPLRALIGIDQDKDKGKGKTAQEPAGLFHELRKLLEQEGYCSRGSDDAMKSSKPLLQPVLKDMVNQGSGTNSLVALRDYLRRPKNERPFDLPDAIDMLHKRGAKSLDIGIQYFSILSDKPYHFSPQRIRKIASLGEEPTLKKLTDGATFCNLCDLLEETGYASEDAAQIVGDIAARRGSAQTLEKLANRKFFERLISLLIEAGYRTKEEAVQALIDIAAKDHSASLLITLVELHDVLTLPRYGFTSAQVVEFFQAPGGIKKLLAFVKGDPDKQVAQALARIAAAASGRIKQVMAARLDSETVEDDSDDDMPDADIAAQAASASASRKRAEVNSSPEQKEHKRPDRKPSPSTAELMALRLRNQGSPAAATAPTETLRPQQPGRALPTHEQEIERRVRDYQPQSNRRFPFHDAKRLGEVDRRLADPEDRTRVHPAWEFDLETDPRDEKNMLKFFPWKEELNSFFTKYGRKENRDLAVGDILQASSDDLNATRNNKLPPSAQLISVEKLSKSDMPESPKFLLGKVGEWAVFVKPEVLKELIKEGKDLVVIGLYSGALIHNDEEYELYLEALGMGDEGALEAARKGEEEYQAYLENNGLLTHPIRVLIRSYLLEAPRSDDDEDVIHVAGAIDSNAMARMNTPLKRSGEKLQKLEIDDDGINTLAYPLILKGRNKEIKKKIREPVIAMVLSIPHLLQCMKDYRLPRFQCMFDYQQAQVEQHIETYIGNADDAT